MSEALSVHLLIHQTPAAAAAVAPNMPAQAISPFWTCFFAKSSNCFPSLIYGNGIPSGTSTPSAAHNGSHPSFKS